MRRVRYSVATSLDGYIAGPNGEADWIIVDPNIDFGAIFNEFDTILVGRRTFEVLAKASGGSAPGVKTFVFSRTLRQQDYPKVTIVSEKPDETVAAIRAKPGKDIWLFGGGLLFRSLAEAGLVDTVEVAVVPVLLGGGIPSLPAPADRIKLKLSAHKVYEKTGIVSLEYAILQAEPEGSRGHNAHDGRGASGSGGKRRRTSAVDGVGRLLERVSDSDQREFAPGRSDKGVSYGKAGDESGRDGDVPVARYSRRESPTCEPTSPNPRESP